MPRAAATSPRTAERDGRLHVPRRSPTAISPQAAIGPHSRKTRKWVVSISELDCIDGLPRKLFQVGETALARRNVGNRRLGPARAIDLVELSTHLDEPHLR